MANSTHALINGWVARLLQSWVAAVSRYAIVVIIIAAAASVWLFHYTVTNIGVNTDTADMISEHLPWRRTFIDYRESFPSQVKNLVVVIESDVPELAETARDRLAAAMQAEPELFHDVHIPGGGEFFAHNGLLFLDVNELEDLADNLAGAQPFIATLARDPSAPALFSLLGTAVENREQATGPLELAPILKRMERSFVAAANEEFYRISWRELLSGGKQDAGQGPQFIMVKPQLNFNEMLPGNSAIKRMRSLITELDLSEDKGIRVRLTGQVALANEELKSVSKGMGLAGGIALLMVAATLFFALGTYRLVIAVVLTLLAGLIGTAAFAAFAVGDLNLISVAFAVLYIGLGVDFAIHLCLRYRELIHSGKQHDDAISTAAGDVGSSLLFCAVTTSVGFYAFFPTTFKGVAELGLISGTGMYISFIATMTLLPALLKLMPLRASGARLPSRNRIIHGLAMLPVQRRGTIRIIALVIGVASLAVIPFVHFDNNPFNLRDPDTESVATFLDLLAKSDTPPLSITLLSDSSTETARIVKEAVTLPTVKNVVSVATLVPNGQQDKLMIISDIAFLLGPDLIVTNTATPTALSLNDIDEFDATLTAYARDAQGDERQAAEDLLGGIKKFQEAFAGADNERQEVLLNELHASLVATLPRNIDVLRDSLRASRITMDNLPAALKERWVTAAGRQRIEVFPAENIMQDEPARRFVSDVRSVDPNATGLPVIHQEAGDAVIDAFQQAFISALIVVSILLLVLLRNAYDVALVLTPLLLAGLVTGAATVIFDIPFNFANIIALPLLLGIGVDNGIHMVHRARAAPPSSGNLLETSTARGVVFSALTTVFSFGNLAYSEHLGTASMGQVLTLGMVLTLCSTLVVLPAILKVRTQT
ncbi:MAG: MMPL family transporter [Gammaproteobacteria bacterium]|nr:MMPL family transporter [Gammaproteobacteria bacterium]